MTTGPTPTGPASTEPGPAATDARSVAPGVLTAAGSAGAWAWVALNVEPVPRASSGEGTDAERRIEAALADAGWLAGQWDQAAETRLELRYLHRPGDGVRCALLGRVQAPAASAATSAALRLLDRLGALPANTRAVPVGSAAEVQQLLNPFPANLSGLVEVRKQIRPGLPSRPDAGVAYYLAVPRFAAGAASWEPLWQAVVDLPQPFMLTVGLEPFVPPAQFVGMLGELAARYGRLAIPGRTARTPLRQQSVALAADPFAAYAARLYDEAWRHYQSTVFRIRITIASPLPLPAALVAHVAATICAPPGDGEITYVSVVPAPDELDTAWHNVTTLDHVRWDRHYVGHLPIAVPSGLRLLAETVDAAEAVSGWRLPSAPTAGGRRVSVSVTAQNLHVDRLETAHVGDTFSNVAAGAVIVNRSTLANSLNAAQVQRDTRTEQPLGPEAEPVERFGNPDVAGNSEGGRVAPNVLRILLVCANPRGSQPLRTAEEDRTLRESIRMSPDRDRIEIETLNAATIDDLRRALLGRPFDIVHFSGHGTRQGLVFEDASGRLLVPSSEALADLLARRQIRVAVLNACYSLSVGRIRAIGTEYTIAASGPISDPAAIEFTRGFYDALGAGLNVPDAFEEGKGSASLKSLAFDAILLRRDEEHVAPRVTSPPAGRAECGVQGRKVLVGVALDVSDSMQGSIRNRSGVAGPTRFDSVQDSLVDLGFRVREDILCRDADSQDSFDLFVYGYGLRIGDGVADLASMWKAAGMVNIDRAARVRPGRLEQEDRKAAAFRDLAPIAQGYGLGWLVDSVNADRVNSATQQFAAEVVDLVVAGTYRLGDTTLCGADVARLFDRTVSEEMDFRLLSHILFGATPMLKASRMIQNRFARMKGEPYDDRTLLVISDGESTDGDPRAVFEQLRKSGINIISIYLTEQDIAEPRMLVTSHDGSWSKGAQLMWEIASPIDEFSPIARYLLDQGWSVEADAKLFVQVNHSDLLKEFVRVVGSQFSSDESSPLPQGR